MDIIYGRNPVGELLKSDSDIDKIYVNKEISDPSLKSLLAKAGERRIIISYCTRQKLDELCQTTKHQGIAAMIPQATYVSVKDILDYAKEKGEDPFIFIAISRLRSFSTIPLSLTAPPSSPPCPASIITTKSSLLS